MSVYFHIRKKLDHFSVDLEYAFDRGVLVIQGESGAGKTTVLNCISGLTCPEEGRIALDGTAVFDDQAGIDLPARRRNIGYLFQNYALFPHMTIQQNIFYGMKNTLAYKEKRSETMDDALSIMENFGISHLRKKYPSRISGGERQRAALARAIVTKPRLLLLDEPFSALDQKTKEVIYREFLSFKEKFSIPAILITHDARESRLFADHQMVLKEGRIVS